MTSETQDTTRTIPLPDLRGDVACPNCGHAVTVVVDGRAVTLGPIKVTIDPAKFTVGRDD